MKMTTKINSMLLEYAEAIEQEILTGRFRHISRSKYAVDIIVLDDRVSIWVGNGPKYTHCYRLENGDGSMRFPPHAFNEAEKCREILWRAVNAEEPRQ